MVKPKLSPAHHDDDLSSLSQNRQACHFGGWEVPGVHGLPQWPQVLPEAHLEAHLEAHQVIHPGVHLGLHYQVVLYDVCIHDRRAYLCRPILLKYGCL
jgi:hypothetical protein